MNAQADIGLIGLAVMGQNLVLNMNDHGFTVAVNNRTKSKIDDFLAGEAASDKQAEALRKLIDLLTRKKSLAGRVARDIQFQALMEIWLYIHVPLTLGLIAALTAHIVSVLFYW